jgi:hypothetical protein
MEANPVRRAPLAKVATSKEAGSPTPIFRIARKNPIEAASKKTSSEIEAFLDSNCGKLAY